MKLISIDLSAIYSTISSVIRERGVDCRAQKINLLDCLHNMNLLHPSPESNQVCRALCLCKKIPSKCTSWAAKKSIQCILWSNRPSSCNGHEKHFPPPTQIHSSFHILRMCAVCGTYCRKFAFLIRITRQNCQLSPQNTKFEVKLHNLPVKLT